MRWIAAPEEAAAVAASLHPDANTIAGLVPARHAAYALIFHPVTDVDGAEHRWDEIAARNGRQVHAAMTFQAIRTPTDETRDRSTPSEHAWPLSSATPIAVLDRLLEYLECSTTTPANVTFCIWTGYAGFSEDVGGWHSVDGGSSWTRMQPKPRQPLMTPEERALPTVVVRGNGYHVYVGSLSASRALLPHTPTFGGPTIMPGPLAETLRVTPRALRGRGL